MLIVCHTLLYSLFHTASDQRVSYLERALLTVKHFSLQILSDHLIRSNFWTVILSLQKLVTLDEDDEPLPDTFDPRDGEDGYPGQDSTRSQRRNQISLLLQRVSRMLRREKEKMIIGESQGKSSPDINQTQATGVFSKLKPKDYVRTLQRYRGNPNEERTKFMENNSTLKEKGLAVSVEQVSIFLCDDNTVISFFEHSAKDIEEPILKRLNTLDTILKRSADGSLVVQAIIDAIIDLAIPVVTAYEDAIGDLELDVLTDPDVERSKSL